MKTLPPVSRRQFLTTAGVILGATAGGSLLAACDSAGGSPSTNGDAALDLVSFQLGWLLSEGQLGEAVALAKGWYADNDIETTLAHGGPSIDGVALVGGGQRMLGQVSSSPSLMLARSQSIPIKAFGVCVQEQPYAYVSLPDNPVHEPADLIGKTVGTQATSALLLQALLAKNDIDPGQVEVVIVGADVAPLTTGQVDVWTGWLSNTTAMRPLGGEFVSMRLWDAGIQLYGYPYYATDTTLQSNGDLVDRWLEATAAGWIYARDNLEEAAQSVVDLQPTLAVQDIKEQGEVLMEHVFTDATDVGGWGTMDRSVWQAQIDTWADLDQFEGPVPELDDIVTFDHLDNTASARTA